MINLKQQISFIMEENARLRLPPFTNQDFYEVFQAKNTKQKDVIRSTHNKLKRDKIHTQHLNYLRGYTSQDYSEDTLAVGIIILIIVGVLATFISYLF